MCVLSIKVSIRKKSLETYLRSLVLCIEQPTVIFNEYAFNLMVIFIRNSHKFKSRMRRFWRELLLNPQNEFGDQTAGTKNLSPQKSLVIRFLNGASKK